MIHTSTHLTPLPGRPASRVRSRAATAAAFVAACAIFVGPTTAHADATPSPSPSATVAIETPTLEAAPAAAGVLRAGTALAISARVSNPTGSALPTGAAHVWLGTSALANAAAVDEWLAGVGSTPAGSAIATTTVSTINAGATAAISLTAPATDPALANLAPGTHPVTVTYAAGTETLTVRTVVTVIGPGETAAATTLIVPVTTAASATSLLSSETLATLTAPGGELTAVLDGVAAAPQALLAVDPTIVASIRVLGSSVPASARTWLDRLEKLPNERIALQFGDADVTTQFDAGLTTLLQPTSFRWVLSERNFAPSDAPSDTPSPSSTTTPAPTVSPTVPAETVVFPTTDHLVDVAPTFDAWWPANGATSDKTVASASTSTTLLLSSDSTGTAAGHARVGDASVISYNSALSDLLSSVAAEPDELSREALLTEATALFRFQAIAMPGKPLALALDRDSEWDADALRAVTSSLSTVGLSQPVSGSALLSTTPVAATLTAAPAPAERISALTGMLADEQRLTTFSAVLDDPELLLGRERARMLRLLGTGWAASDAFPAAIQDQHVNVNEILGSVELIQPTQVTQVSSGSNIPMFVRNDLPFDVTVDIIATTSDVRLDVENHVTVPAAAQSTARVSLPVTARISNGEVRISLQLQATNGTPIGSEKYADVTVRAEWERIGIAVLGAAVALLLIFGTFRMIRRRRNVPEDAASKPSRQDAREAYRTAPGENEEEDTRG